MQRNLGLLVAGLAIPLLFSFVTHEPRTETLEERLKAICPKQLAADARNHGDARRGAVVFYQAALSCTRCHVAEEAANRLGPDLTTIGKGTDKGGSDEHVIESILEPSKTIRNGYESVVLEIGEKMITGFLISENAKTVVVRDAARNYKEVEFDRAGLTDYAKGTLSLMPAGLVNLLTSKQQFLDLVRYLFEIRDGGSERAKQLEPDPSLYAERPLPEYESRIDHAGFIKGLDQAAFGRGKQIYERLCINCHGTQKEEGSLPTSLKFASQPFKNGSDPHTMYETLTRGFGMMVAQTWMVPSQKYDVIHYIREAYLEKHNPSQYFAVDQAYLDGLPKGDSSAGRRPSNIVAWQQMDYGPNQVMTLEIGKDAKQLRLQGQRDPARRRSGRSRAGALLDGLRLRHTAGRGSVERRRVHRLEQHPLQRPPRDPPATSRRSARDEPHRPGLGAPERRELRGPAPGRARQAHLRPAAAELGPVQGDVLPRPRHHHRLHGRRRARARDARRAGEHIRAGVHPDDQHRRLVSTTS